MFVPSPTTMTSLSPRNDAVETHARAVAEDDRADHDRAVGHEEVTACLDAAFAKGIDHGCDVHCTRRIDPAPHGIVYPPAGASSYVAASIRDPVRVDFRFRPMLDPGHALPGVQPADSPTRHRGKRHLRCRLEIPAVCDSPAVRPARFREPTRPTRSTRGARGRIRPAPDRSPGSGSESASRDRGERPESAAWRAPRTVRTRAASVSLRRTCSRMSRRSASK